MPYISQARREALDKYDRPRTAGELNYVISRAVIEYIRGKSLGGEFSYQDLNDCVGALENAKDEFQRRFQHPYEDRAIQRNSDIYEPILPLLDESAQTVRRA
jgi:hypothetical protein